MKQSSSSSGLQELWSIHNLEPILISFCLIGLRQATGVIAFIANAVYFFEDSGIAISPSHATIFIGIINIIVPIIAGEIHKNFSRRATLGVSSMFVINLQIFIAMYLYFQESDGPFKEYTSNPTVLVSLVIMYIVAFGVGPDPISFMYLGEGLPSNIRGIGSSVGTSFNQFTILLSTFLFAELSSNFGYHLTFLMCAFLTAVLAFTAYSFMLETKDMSPKDVDAYYSARKKKVE